MSKKINKGTTSYAFKVSIIYLGCYFVATLFPEADNISGAWGAPSVKPISQDMHRATSVFTMDIYLIGYITLGSCMLKKTLSANFFTAFVTYTNTQVNEIIEKLPFLH